MFAIIKSLQWALTVLWRPKRLVELYVRVPLWFWRDSHYHIEDLSFTDGWHWHYLLIVADTTEKAAWAWRVQTQVKNVPLCRESDAKV